MLSASPSNRGPSVGLTAVDSMAGGRIKALCTGLFRKAPGPRDPGSARITRRRAVLADRVYYLAVPALFPLHVNRDDRVRRRHQQENVKNQPEDHAKHDQDQVE